MQAISRLYINKAHFISMNSQLTEQLGLAKVAGTLSKSTEIMTIVNDLMRTPQLMQTMQQMSKEMMKVCLIGTLFAAYMSFLMDAGVELAVCQRLTHSAICVWGSGWHPRRDDE